MRPAFYPAVEQNGHVKMLSEYFGEIRSAPANISQETSIIFLCFSNRCGSNYLAELLASNGTYNLAGEDLNWDTVLTHCKANGIESFQDYVAFLVRRLKRKDRVFIKVATSQIELLGKAGILDQVLARSKFILIERSDKLGQAISYAIAFGTGRYTSWMASSTPPEAVEFSRKRIDHIIASIADSYRQFDVFFAKNGIQPVNVVYEQLAANPVKQVSWIAESLGLDDLEARLSGLRLEKQAGAVNALWRQRYLSDEN